MKRYFIVVIAILILIYPTYMLIEYSIDLSKSYKQDGIRFASKVDEKYFYIYEDDEFKKTFIKGVNLGATKPGYYPGEFGITKEDYLRWFKYISDLNANTIRVYTIMMPVFYDALLEFNEKAEKPLYLIHGLWVNEEDITTYMDAFNPVIKENTIDEAKTLVDVIHGNTKIPFINGKAYGDYKSDISNYVIGFILGIEWDPQFVINTNEKNQEKNGYNGDYLYTVDASPFESFLCELADKTISYETINYKRQRPIALPNWPTTDPLNHPNEPLETEDMVSVNVEHIKWKDTFKPGMFASYHIYPYYPDFMNYQHEYATYVDDNGKINPYKAYLIDLIKVHTMPVLVAEFGIPSSRGMAHVNIHNGYNQGFVEETKQGEYLIDMLDDIHQTGYAGALIFTWQDEWFKRTWNTMDFDNPDRRAYWSNVQTNEQMFGLLSFDPGTEDDIILNDGDLSDWDKTSSIGDEKISYAVNSDERYLYLKITKKNFDENKDKLFIAIDTIKNQGNDNAKDLDLKLDLFADFLITISGEHNSRVLVDSYYDPYYYLYAYKLGFEERNVKFENKNSGYFNPIYLALNRPLYLPEDDVYLPMQKYETGKLKHGIGNPASSDYDSLSDFYISGDTIEVRIPWMLLNFMDPSNKEIISDLYVNDIEGEKIDSISFQCILKSDAELIKSEIIHYTYDNWDMPIYHERLKKSYYAVKKAFEKLE